MAISNTAHVLLQAIPKQYRHQQCYVLHIHNSMNTMWLRCHVYV